MFNVSLLLHWYKCNCHHIDNIYRIHLNRKMNEWVNEIRENWAEKKWFDIEKCLLFGSDVSEMVNNNKCNHWNSSLFKWEWKKATIFNVCLDHIVESKAIHLHHLYFDSFVLLFYSDFFFSFFILVSVHMKTHSIQGWLIWSEAKKKHFILTLHLVEWKSKNQKKPTTTWQTKPK